MKRVAKAVWHISPMVVVYLLWLSDSYTTMACFAVLVLGIYELAEIVVNDLVDAQRDYIKTLEKVIKGIE